MKIAFTLCSNNYYAQALVLGQSFLQHNPDYQFYVGLIDQKSDLINYQQFNIKVLPIADIEPDVYSLALKFNIVELNTAVKPQYFLHFIKQIQAHTVIYLDPDICIYQSFKNIEILLETNDILLTPHILTPIPIDGKTPFENDFLNYGLYNLGFIAVKASVNTLNMLQWWKDRTYNFGYHQLAKGLFVDQLWINLVPILFQKIYIISHPGYNIGPWNLHERVLSIQENVFFVNNSSKLYFFHFSNFNPLVKAKLHTVFTRYDLHNRPDLVEIYTNYTQMLLAHNYVYLKTIPCHYVEWKNHQLLLTQLQIEASLSIKKKVFRKLKTYLPAPIKNLILAAVKY